MKIIEVEQKSDRLMSFITQKASLSENGVPQKVQICRALKGLRVEAVDL